MNQPPGETQPEATGSGRRQPLKPAYLIVGDDLPKIETALKRLRARISEGSGTDLNIDEFNAQVTSGGEVVNAANTLAFLGGTRLVLVERVHAWGKADKELISRYLKSPSPDTCLALIGDKLPATDVLRVAMAAHGDVLEYNAPKEGQLPQWLVQEAAKMRLSLGLPEARLLAQRCGDNQNILLRELEKLKSYVGDVPVGSGDIRLLSTRTIEASIFDLLDDLALGRGAETFGVAEELLASGERVEVLFYRILRHFHNLSRVAALRDAGKSRDEIQSELKMKAYPVRKLVEQTALLGHGGIARRLAVLAETDARMKGLGTLPGEMELELCLGRLLAA